LESNYAFLATAVVIVKVRQGNYHKCRAVLDSGSQVNFISKKFQNVLNLPSIHVMLPVSGIGSSRIQSTTKIEVQVSSGITQFTLNISCYVLPSIIDTLSSHRRSLSCLGISDEVISHLADPHFDKPGPVYMLIGAGIFFDLLESDKINLETGNLILQNTKLGWIMTGEFSANCLLSVGTSLEDNFNSTRNSNESFGSKSKINKRCLEEQLVVKHFEEIVSRRADGRFVVCLPVKVEIDQLGNSLIMATSRFLNLERRLSRDKKLLEEYVKFMTEYREMGHMERIIEEKPLVSRIFYLPHHAVSV